MTSRFNNHYVAVGERAGTVIKTGAVKAKVNALNDGTNEGNEFALLVSIRTSERGRKFVKSSNEYWSRQTRKSRKDEGIARGFREKRRGRKIYYKGTWQRDKIRWDIFVKLSMFNRNPRNVSKISADISDNALSLLKIENYWETLCEREIPVDTWGKRVRHLTHNSNSISRLPRENECRGTLGSTLKNDRNKRGLNNHAEIYCFFRFIWRTKLRVYGSTSLVKRPSAFDKI